MQNTSGVGLSDFACQKSSTLRSCGPYETLSAVGLMAEGRANTADDIRELMSGNLCRCGAYPNIVAAIAQVMINHDFAVASTPVGGEPVLLGAAS